MHLILRYPSGRRVDGILLAAGPDRLRIVVRRVNETMELRLREGQWLSEREDPIEVDGWIGDGSGRMADFCSRLGARTSTATCSTRALGANSTN
jgi:hypothetical protein